MKRGLHPMRVDAVEANPARCRVRMVRAVHNETAPKPVATIDPENIAPAVDLIREQIYRLKRAQAGSYLFIDDHLNAYVLSELRSVTPVWLRDHFAWLVCFYAMRRRDGNKKNDDGTPFMTASTAGVSDDVGQHVDDMRIRHTIEDLASADA